MYVRFIPAILLFAATTILPAQQISSDSIVGTILTPQGGHLAGAAVTLVPAVGGDTRSTLSDADGTFRFSALPDGAYAVTVRKAGFRNASETADLSSGHRVDLSITLALDGNQPKMQVRHENQPAIRITRPVVLGISDQNPQPLPANLQMLLDSPGIGNVAGTADDIQAATTGLAAVQEFRLMQDYGGTALMSAISRPGMLHGSLYGMIGYSPLPEAGRLGNVQLPVQQYGASLGAGTGNNSWFASYDQHVLDRRQLLSEMLADPSALHRSDPRSLTSSTLLTRFDHRFSDRDSIDLRYDRAGMRGNPLDGTGPVQGLNMDQQMLSAENTLTLSPSTINRTEGQFIAGNLQLPAGAPAYGIQADAATLRRYRVYEAADNLYHQMGRQALSMGGDFLASQMSISFLENGLGNATFRQSSRSTGLYVLNQWKVSPQFELTAGTRYDLQFLKGIETDTNNLAPQIGFAWSPSASSGTVLRGGFGLIYSQLPLPALSGAFSDGSNTINLARSGSFSARSHSLPWSALGTYTTLDPSIQNAYAEQGGLEIEQSVGARTSVAAAYQHIAGVHIGFPSFHPAVLCASTTGCNTSNEFGGGRQIGSEGDSSYDDLTISFVQSPIHWGTYRVSYTRAQVTAQGGSDNYGSFGDDQMQRISFLGSVHTAMQDAPGWWNRLNRGLTLSGYGDLTGRSQLPGLDFIHLNARLTKSMDLSPRARLEFFAETANMLDYRTFSMSRAAVDLSSYGMGVLSSYQRYAELTSPASTETGLRVSF